MAHLAALWKMERENHVEAYYAAAAAAEEGSAREWAAAVAIQKVWRGYESRQRVKHIRDCAIKMELTYQRWKSRKEARTAKIATLAARRAEAYHGAATKLQALWRGYRSRSDIFDFRSRAKYLEGRVDDVATMTQKMADYGDEVQGALAAAEDARRRKAYDERARREHFMLSTTSRIGVYSTALGGQTPEVNEADIRAAQPPLPPPAKRLSQTRRQSQRHTHWVLPHPPSPRKKVQGPFLPPDKVWELKNRSPNRSLRMETSFTHREEATRQDKRAEWRGRVTDAPFVPVNRHPRPIGSKEPVPSLRASDRFVDAPLLSPAAPATRQMTFRKLEKLPHKSDFLSTTKVAPLSSDYSV
eukprot:CAMPEP_0182926012 /NCGR_PEP_ID=MMETSP0105_2-20130417/10779_1 /TAXON_ID=81532 ORGANISM="Acanthoeca-like sp., Strain 10tr" /NCGR_SAMPLE_ID=MMETSP0105_2 /ASSEMBLY_ACC=CAM_ASM_000205 /LENGTH=356 /DNA_ID=CAMNT_0025063883 /DNA_START=290 /DNA_END=1360 /DNA_ORIENTATION=+